MRTNRMTGIGAKLVAVACTAAIASGCPGERRCGTRGDQLLRPVGAEQLDGEVPGIGQMKDHHRRHHHAVDADELVRGAGQAGRELGIAELREEDRRHPEAPREPRPVVRLGEHPEGLGEA